MLMDQKIATLLAGWRGRAFAWGTADCCQFAREAAWHLHGIVVDAPAYISERDAARTLRRLGGYEALMASTGLQRRRALIAARVGDFVTFRHEGPGLFDRGIALVTGTQAHAPTAVGLLSIGRAQWLECWGVA